jgi:NAD(P)-dependent dehydrogenase (short-subunit alcohol dehydrogenase family)
MDQSIQALGRIDILVNNASIFDKHSLSDAYPERMMHEMQVNAFSPIELMRIFALDRYRPTSDWPEAGIVNILDRRVSRYEQGAIPYCLSKNALRDATMLAALELGPEISVNAIAPGPILPPPGQGEEYLAEKAGPIVLAKRPSPEDVATGVLFLLQAQGITGQVLFVDSGQHLL